jgi:pimeloyl-ACP methyl ester carboxylesterase
MIIDLKEIFLKWLVAGCFVVCIFSCSDNNDPAPRIVEEDNLVESTSTGSRTAAELKFLIQLAGINIDPDFFQYDVDIYNVVYKTTYKEEEINASGLILVPKTSNTVPMISYQHGTIVQQSQAPSVQSKSSQDVISLAALSSMGFITVVPDMIGFGESKEIFHPYFVEEPTSRAVIDMLRAAASLAEEKDITFDTRVFLAGYSQGGYATLATHKELEEEPLEGFEVAASFPGAGGYDIRSMQKHFFSLDTYPDPYYIAYLALAYQSYYEEPQLVANFFNEPYATRIPSLFNGTTSSSEINFQLTDDIHALVEENLLLNFESDDMYEFLREKFDENSLLGWQPQAPVYFYHGDADVTVPYENTVLTYENLLDNGASAEKLKLINLAGKNHSTAVEPYIVDVLSKLQTLK